MISTQNRLAAATSNLKSGTDFSIAAIMARDELSRESSEYSISKDLFSCENFYDEFGVHGICKHGHKEFATRRCLIFHSRYFSSKMFQHGVVYFAYFVT